MSPKRKVARSEPAEHLTKMIRTTMETPAWRALWTTAQALYPWLKLEGRGPQANNNGKVRFSVREAAEKLGVQMDTAAMAFHDLQAKGFLVLTEHAVLGIEGAAKSPAFELTELALPHGDKPDGRKLYRDWRPGADFPVHKARAHNPKGANGKAKSRHENHDILTYQGSGGGTSLQGQADSATPGSRARPGGAVRMAETGRALHLPQSDLRRKI